MVHFALQKRPVAMQKRNASPFLKTFLRQSQSSTPELQPKKSKHHSIDGNVVSTPRWLIQITKTSYFLSRFIRVQSTVKQHDLLSFQRR